MVYDNDLYDLNANASRTRSRVATAALSVPSPSSMGACGGCANSSSPSPVRGEKSDTRHALRDVGCGDIVGTVASNTLNGHMLRRVSTSTAPLYSTFNIGRANGPAVQEAAAPRSKNSRHESKAGGDASGKGRGMTMLLLASFPAAVAGVVSQISTLISPDDAR